MSSKALPALVLLTLLCGQLVTDGRAQTYIGATRGGSPAGMRPLPYARGGSPAAGMQPPPYTRGGSSAGDDGTGRLSGVEEEKAFMMHHSLPARERPVPVPPTSNYIDGAGQQSWPTQDYIVWKNHEP